MVEFTSALEFTFAIKQKAKGMNSSLDNVSKN